MAGCKDTMQRVLIRNENYLQGPVDIELKSHSKFAVELRKHKRSNTANEKRFKKPERRPDISPIILEIWPDLHNYHISVQFSLLFEILNSNASTGMKLAILEHINSCTSDLKTNKHLVVITNQNLASIISLVNSDTQDVILAAIDSLINFTFCYEDIAEPLIKLCCVEALLKKINTSYDITFSAIWCISNLAGSSQDIRRRLINYGILEYMVEFLKKPKHSEKMLCMVSWAIRNLCRPILTIDKELLSGLLDELKRLFRNPNIKTRTNSLMSLIFITETEEYIPKFIATNTLSEVLSVMGSTSTKLSFYAIKLVGNVLSSVVTQNTQILLDLCIISKLSDHIYSYDTKIRKNVYFCFSNIAAGTDSQRQSLLDSYGFVKLMNGLLDKEFSVREEAWYLFYNFSVKSNRAQIKDMLYLGLFAKIKQALEEETSVKLIKGLLKILKNFLTKAGDNLVPEISDIVTPTIESLLLNPNLSEDAQEILEKFSIKE
jgi:uncharacterized protein YuzB (UPF0349 family)